MSPFDKKTVPEAEGINEFDTRMFVKRLEIVALFNECGLPPSLFDEAVKKYPNDLHALMESLTSMIQAASFFKRHLEVRGVLRGDFDRTLSECDGDLDIAVDILSARYRLKWPTSS